MVRATPRRDERLQAFHDAYKRWRALTEKYDAEMLLIGDGKAVNWDELTALIEEMRIAHTDWMAKSAPFIRTARAVSLW